MEKALMQVRQLLHQTPSYGIAAGKVTITATTADGGLADTSEVTVTAPYITKGIDSALDNTRSIL
ncbi:hypothetical protein [Providencia hangzhouensis]|uniref:hypothetical protein n=1 Tax=Providencia hangzhouensis TaxID=3031799 RepID=UPI0034DD940B